MANTLRESVAEVAKKLGVHQVTFDGDPRDCIWRDEVIGIEGTGRELRQAWMDGRRQDAEAARSLHGTHGRLFVRDGEEWLDTETGRRGPRAELEDAWLADLSRA